jgi:hypothetical protein
MPSGKAMPLDAEPNPDGNVFRHSDGQKAAVLTADEIKAVIGEVGSDVNANRYTSHFATCPNAAKHRKKEASP